MARQLAEVSDRTLSSVAVVVAAEAQRLGSVHRTLVFGHLPPESADLMQGRVELRDPEALLRENTENEDIPPELVVLFSTDPFEDLQTRILAHSLEQVSARWVLVIRPLGAEIPVPLIELRRGLLLEAPELGYRLYGRR